jgi:hypothetical protein
MSPFSSRILSICLLLSGGGQAIAQGLSDPTRPSDFLGGDSPAGIAGDTGEPVLQAVVLERNRKYAIISGQIVKLGGLYDGARLVQIGDSEVVLRNGPDVKRLKLLSGIDKKPARAVVRSREGVR